ncbi:hypothetical protein IMG5_066690 [Ichthyophthirius multifiliis]|uniref:Transmembrane protein n=1 Tax=Ichthyophthirius multifiliis TaxID=5932 RepID=G0QPD1_ICHMU|nr:hypothetical protein IMG5_066690 [Ichthyophthirius multifiliis]EGR32924.1 hypothetical protein IMG5_066690 [Ichthyophthirius multifiliis]|eukprot:XP_004036910.1 hypothetical protein IMG5_066690 [Ichthyophthirius multifiliis]
MSKIQIKILISKIQKRQIYNSTVVFKYNKLNKYLRIQIKLKMWRQYVLLQMIKQKIVIIIIIIIIIIIMITITITLIINILIIYLNCKILESFLLPFKKLISKYLILH